MLDYLDLDYKKKMKRKIIIIKSDKILQKQAQYYIYIINIYNE